MCGKDDKQALVRARAQGIYCKLEVLRRVKRKIAVSLSQAKPFGFSF
jgi:uncharacterized protein YjhX (UPF0386 family)